MDPVDALLKTLGAVQVPRVRAWLAALAERDAPAELTAEDIVLVRATLRGDAVAATEWRACVEERLVLRAVAAIPSLWEASGDPGAQLSTAAADAAAAAAATLATPHAAAAAAAAAATTPQLPKQLSAVALAVCLVLPPDVKAAAAESEELLVRWLGGGAAATRHVKAARRWVPVHKAAVLHIATAPLTAVPPLPEAAAPLPPPPLRPAAADGAVVTGGGGTTFAATVGEALDALGPLVAAAGAAIATQLYPVSALRSVAKVCLDAVRSRESGAGPAADRIVDAAWAATAATPWLPVRHLLLECAPSNKHTYAVPRWEYEAVHALAITDVRFLLTCSSDARELARVARDAVEKPFDARFDHRWWTPAHHGIGPDTVPLQPSHDDASLPAAGAVAAAAAAATGRLPLGSTWDTVLWVNLLRQHARRAGWSHPSCAPPPELEEVLLTHVARAGGEAATAVRLYVDRAAAAVTGPRNQLAHPKDGAKLGVVSRVVAFRFVMRVAELANVLRIQHAFPGGEQYAIPCMRRLRGLASDLVRPVVFPPPALRDAAAWLVAEVAGGGGTGPLLALVAPGEPLGLLALLPHALVVDTYCHHAPGAAAAALSSLTHAGMSSSPDMVAASSPLRIAFQDAAARDAALVSLDDRLLQPVSAALSSDFVGAIGNTDGRGVPWAQPGREVVSGVAAHSLWSSTSRDCRAPSMQLVRNAANALACASNATRRPVTVLLPRWDTYAHSHREAGAEVAFCRPDGSADTAYPALAAVFITALAAVCSYPIQVVVLTDDAVLARSPADEWLAGVISRTDDLCATGVKPRTVFVMEAVLEYMLQRRCAHLAPRADGVHLRQRGGGSVPFVAASAGGTRGSVVAAAVAAAGEVRTPTVAVVSTWKEAGDNLAVLRHAGLQLLYDGLAAAVLEDAAADPVFYTTYRHLRGDTSTHSGAGRGGGGGDDDEARSAGTALALHFAMGGLRPDWLWPIVHDGGKDAVGCEVAARRDEALTALENVLVERVLTQREAVLCLTLEHTERSGGSVAVAQFAWECYARHGLAVARVDPTAVHRLADVRTAAGAAKAVQLAACIAAGIPVAEAGAVFSGHAAPILVLLADFPGQPALVARVQEVAKQLQAGSNMRVVVLRTRRAASSGGDTATLAVLHREVVVQLRSPTGTEVTRIRACQLGVAQVLFPRTSRDELQRQLEGVLVDRATTGSGRLFRRLRGMLTFARLGAGGDVAAALARRAMYGWAVDALRHVYDEAAKDPRRVAALRAFLFAALVDWCGGTCGVSYATLATVVHNPGQQRWVFDLAADAEDVVMGEARACAVQQLGAHSGASVAVTQSGRLLPFAPAAAWQGAVATCGDPPVRADVGVSAHLHRVADSAVDAARGAAAAAPAPHVSFLLPPGCPTAREAERAVREALSPPGVGGDIWAEAVRTDVDGRLAFISRDAAALLLSVALGFEAARCAPAATTVAGGAGGLSAMPPIIGDVWADGVALPSVSPPPVGVFALSVCLLHALVHDGDALLSVQALGDDDDEHAAARLGGQLVWEAFAVFKRPPAADSLARRAQHSPAIGLLVDVWRDSRVVDAASVFSSHACRLLLLAAAVWKQQWRLVSDTLRLLFGYIRPGATIEAVPQDGGAASTSGLQSATCRAAVNAAVLFAASSGLAATGLSLLSEGASLRIMGTHNMLGNAHMRLLSAGMPVRVQAVRDAAGVVGQEGAMAEAATQVADAFVAANEARRWYCAARATRRPRGVPVSADKLEESDMQNRAHEADLWLTVLEGAADIATVLEAVGEGGGVFDAMAGEIPLAHDSRIEEAIRRAVASSDVLNGATTESHLTPAYRVTDRVATLPAAATLASDLLRELHAILWRKAGQAERSAMAGTHLEHVKRWLSVTRSSDAGKALRVHKRQLGEAVARGVASDVELAAYACADTANVLWGLQLSRGDGRTEWRDSRERFHAIATDRSNVEFIFTRILLPHVASMGYPSLMLELLVELAPLHDPTCVRSDEVLAQLRGAAGVDVGNSARSAAARMLLLGVLLCKLIAAGKGADADECALFRQLNGYIDGAAGSGVRWKEEYHKDLPLVLPYRLMRYPHRPLPGTFFIAWRHRFSRDAEAYLEARAETEAPSALVHGTVVFLQEAPDRDGKLPVQEGVLQLDSCDVQLYFRITVADTRVLGEHMPVAHCAATAYVDIDCMRFHAGVFAVAVQRRVLGAGGAELPRLPLQTYLPLPPALFLSRTVSTPAAAHAAAGSPGSAGAAAAAVAAATATAGAGRSASGARPAVPAGGSAAAAAAAAATTATAGAGRGATGARPPVPAGGSAAAAAVVAGGAGGGATSTGARPPAAAPAAHASGEVAAAAGSAVTASTGAATKARLGDWARLVAPLPPRGSGARNAPVPAATAPRSHVPAGGTMVAPRAPVAGTGAPGPVYIRPSTPIPTAPRAPVAGTGAVVARPPAPTSAALPPPPRGRPATGGAWPALPPRR